jgi:hypothetical protein
LLLLLLLLMVQVDMLDSQEEVDAVLDFVASNTSNLLQVRLPGVECGGQVYLTSRDFDPCGWVLLIAVRVASRCGSPPPLPGPTQS